MPLPFQSESRLSASRAALVVELEEPLSTGAQRTTPSDGHDGRKSYLKPRERRQLLIPRELLQFAGDRQKRAGNDPARAGEPHHRLRHDVA